MWTLSKSILSVYLPGHKFSSLGIGSFLIMNHRSCFQRSLLGATRRPCGDRVARPMGKTRRVYRNGLDVDRWEGLTYDRWNQGCAQKEAAGKAACGQIPASPRPCGNIPKVSPADAEVWLGRADPRGGEQPELGSPVSSNESLPYNRTSTARQNLSSRSHSEPKGAPCSALNAGTPCCPQKHNHQGMQPW